MRVGIAQINPTLGHFKHNKEKIFSAIKQAKEKKCELLVFPEAALCGYHPFDLLERPEFVKEQLRELNSISKKIPEGLAVLVGAFSQNTTKLGRPYFNSAALLIHKKPIRFFNKQSLPTGDVFDESRFVENGDLSKNFFKWKGKSFFVTICEDMWTWPNKEGKSVYKTNPLKKIKNKNIDLVINMSASPYHIKKENLREYMAHQTAKHFKTTFLYANIVGAQDEIIFDGQSFVMQPNGKKVLTCESFHEDFNVFDLNTKEAWHQAQQNSEKESLRRALVLGIRDFCAKTGISKVHLGLSGGIDSAVVACLAVDALGADCVTGIALPGPFNDPKSLESAESLSKHLLIKFIKLEIENTYNAVLSEITKKLNYQGFSVVNENLQSRIRGLILMAYANKENSMLLTTGNKSEYATGYATLYGDMCGGLAPIGDLTKQQVYELANYYNSEAEIIPQFIIEREPSAELRPNQKDQDSLPEYKILDHAVHRLVSDCLPVRGKTQEWLLETIFKTEFKRWQAAPILKVSEHAFGRGRRWPIAHRFRIG